MGNDRLNTTEANADLASLLEAATPGPWRVEDGAALIWGDCDRDDMTTRGMGYPIAYAEFAKRASWAKGPNLEQGEANAALIARAPDLAAEVLRLRAEAREAALQYLSDTGQMSERIDELVAANAALAADNARLTKRVEDARDVITVMQHALIITDKMSSKPLSDSECVDIGVAKDCARAWLAGGVE